MPLDDVDCHYANNWLQLAAILHQDKSTQFVSDRLYLLSIVLFNRTYKQIYVLSVRNIDSVFSTYCFAGNDYDAYAERNGHMSRLCATPMSLFAICLVPSHTNACLKTLDCLYS